MKRIINFLIPVALLIACNENSSIDNATNITKIDTLKKVKSLPESSSEKSDEVYVGKCAILVEPLQYKIDSLKKVYDSEKWAALLDDNLNYISKARTLLTANGIRIVNRKGIGFVYFKKADGQLTKMEISEFFWGVVLFNGKEEPIEADLTTIDEEYKRYMK